MDFLDFITYPIRWWKGGIWYKVFRWSPPFGERIWRRVDSGKEIEYSNSEELLRIEIHS